MSKPLLLIAVVSMLCACTLSPAQQTRYYLLDDAFSNASVTTHTDKIQVLISDVRIADYLNQSNLAMQLQGHQLHYSRQHVWAEKLKSGITKALQAELNRQSDSHHFLVTKTPYKSVSGAELLLQFDHFVPTDQGRVIASGTYWLSDQGTGQRLRQPFYLTQPLEQDGYPQAVKQLRNLLSQLAKDIIQALSAVEKP